VRRLLVALSLALFPASAALFAQTAPSPAPTPRPAWIVKSDANADVLLKVFARFAPEGAGQVGVSGVDEQVLDLQPRLDERAEAANQEALAELERRRAAEVDPLVRQDLDILIQSAKNQIEGDALSRKYELTYFDVPLTIFRGLRSLLDDQIPAERRAAALVRLKKYAGETPGTTPLTVLAEQRMRERLGDSSLLGPPRAEVEKNLGNTTFYLDGIEKLFQKYQVAGYEAPCSKLKAQVAAYNEFVKSTILPLSRTDFRLPPELYRSRLKNFGVDMAPEALADRARVSYVEIRNEMRAIAPLVAKEKGFTVTDYRDVLRALKKDQIVGEAILPHYQARLASLEEIVRRERVVTLPTRPAQIKLGETLRISCPAKFNSAKVNDRSTKLYPQSDGRSFGLLPISVKDKPGSFTLIISSEDGAAQNLPIVIRKTIFPSQNVKLAPEIEGLHSTPEEMALLKTFKENISDSRSWHLPCTTSRRQR